MRWIALSVSIGTVISSGCTSQVLPPISGNCPQFPSKQFEQKGSAFGSTSFGEMKHHASPSHHVDIPGGPLGDARIILQPTGCFGTCPSYRVELRGDGKVLFHGDGFVTFSGDHQTSVSPLVIQCLLKDFRAVDFWSLDTEYIAEVTDLPTYKISLTIGGMTKSLTDYAGRMVGMPPSVAALEQTIDEAASSDTWINGNANTISALEAEHFNFQSRTAADLLATASQGAPDSVVFALLDHGAPINGQTSKSVWDERFSAVEAAAMNGRIALVRRLIGAGAFAKGGKSLVTATLQASVASQKAELVAEILKYHPDVNSTDKHGDTALALIFTGAHPHASDTEAVDQNAAIIRMLGKAGADPNLANSEHADLLEIAGSKEDKDALIAIGARRGKRAAQ